MTLTQIYRIIKAYKEGRDREDQRGQNAKKTVRTPEMIVAVKDYIESDRRVTYTDIEEAFGLTPGTVNTIIKDDLDLIKKSARWVPRLLDFEQKKSESIFQWIFANLPLGRPTSYSLLLLWMSLWCPFTPQKQRPSQNNGSQRGFQGL